MHRAVREAKLKCRYCQAVFTGTTRLAPEALPPDATLPVHAPRATEPPKVYPLPTRRRSMLPVAILLAGLIGLAIVGVLFYQKYQHQQKNADAPASPVAAPIQAPPVVKTPPATTLAPVAPQPPTKKPAAANEPEDAGPEIEVTECVQLEGQTEESTTFVGAYINNLPYAFKWLQVVVTITREDGKITQIPSGRFENIPAGWEGRFSIDASFRLKPGMRISDTLARGVKAERMQGWELKNWDLEVTDEDAIKITGVATNTTKQSLVKLIVWCDFFTKQGVYVGSAQGTFRQDDKTLGPQQDTVYDIHFDPKEAGYSARLLADPKPRLLGQSATPSDVKP